MNQQIMALIIIMIMFLLLLKNTFEPVVIFIAGTAVFLGLGYISLDEAVSGFANKGVITVAVLFVIAGTLQKTSYLQLLAGHFLGKGGNEKTTYLKIMLPVTLLSAFINNTPVVAIFIPLVRQWALKNGISPSKLLLPISYAAIFGGMLTLIGTSTNLVISGLLEEYGYESLKMFEIGKLGIFLVASGMLYMLFIGSKLLPDNEDLLSEAEKDYREYLISLKVSPECSLINKSVAKSGLRNLKGLYLFEIIREGDRVFPINPQKVFIQVSDVLVFTGMVETIAQLQEIPGLYLDSSSEDIKELFRDENTEIIEAVVAENFPFLEQTVKESNFRARYDAAVIAVLRQGKRINLKIGDIRLKAGDVLLMVASKDFYTTWETTRDFYLINSKGKSEYLSKKAGVISIISFLALIILASFNLFPILYAALLALSVLMLTGITTPQEAWKSINWDTIIIIALSFAIGKSLINSGTANLMAEKITFFASRWGESGALAAVFLLTFIFTEIITNNAAAVLSFPVAISIAAQAGADPRTYAIVVALAASTCFASPIGYQTNLMVYGPGGYKFSDYLRVGLPLTLIFLILTVALAPLIYSF